MGANNVKSLEMLGASRRKPIFKVHNQDTVTVYDPAYILKCTRNLFLKYNVQIKPELIHNQLLVTAKGACTYTGKTGAGSNSSIGCNVNKWEFSHAASPAELPVRQITVPDLYLTSRVESRIFPFHTCIRQWEVELCSRTNREAYSKMYEEAP